MTSPPADSPPVATLAAGTPSPDPGRPTWSVWPAPAKVNLFLRIVGRRPDGYHLLQSVFRILEWGDTLRLRVRADGRIVPKLCWLRKVQRLITRKYESCWFIPRASC